jgi:hypothetical protein
VEYSLPGYCGELSHTALVVLEVSRPVPHDILSAPYRVAVLLWLEDGEWVARALWTFSSDHYTRD